MHGYYNLNDYRTAGAFSILRCDNTLQWGNGNGNHFSFRGHGRVQRDG